VRSRRTGASPYRRRGPVPHVGDQHAAGAEPAGEGGERGGALGVGRQVVQHAAAEDRVDGRRRRPREQVGADDLDAFDDRSLGEQRRAAVDGRHGESEPGESHRIAARPAAGVDDGRGPAQPDAGQQLRDPLRRRTGRVRHDQVVRPRQLA
jgi:hypothetical protein